MHLSSSDLKNPSHTMLLANEQVLSDGSAVFTPGISERRSSVTTYMHPGIKSGEAQSSTSQLIGATRQYDAFGNLDSSTGTWKGPFGYGGAFGYQETGDHGLRLLGHRYYDSSTGRFLTRDPIKDGRNWYGYCDANPTGFADPTGLVKVVVYFYHVFGGGNHGGILVEDNEVGSPTYGTKWSFSGGPERYDFWNPGALESKSGKWQPGQQDWKNGGKDFVGSVSLIDDCTEPVGPWLSEFKLAEESLLPVQYSPILQAPNEANSNSWCSALIHLVGLADEMNRATQKRGGLPWVPGWGHVPTAWRALFSSQ